MANLLTGDFEAVVQIAVRQINGLLATLHQHGADDDAPLKLLHSVVMRVGDPHRRPPDFGDFGDWVLEFQKARSRGRKDALRDELVGMAPPGAAKLLLDAFSGLGVFQIPEDPPAVVRGTVKLQLASPTISAPEGSASQVTIHSFVRGHYYPDAGTDAMPEPLHGEVQATFVVRQIAVPGGRRLLIQPSSQDSQIQFIPVPGTGLSAADVSRISTQVRKSVREDFTLLPVDLPSNFAFADFKGLGSGAGQALALPLRLSQEGPPSGNVQSISNLFIGPAGFAVAVSKEFVKSVFQPTIDGLLQLTQDFTVSTGFPFYLHPHYHFSVTSVDLDLKSGSIDFTIKGKATSPSWYAPNYNNIVVTQRLTLAMFLNMLFVLAPDDELSISGLPGAAIDTVRHASIAARNQALPPAQQALNNQLLAARTRFNNALGTFDHSASTSFRAGTSEDPGAGASGAIAITPDGVIVRGDISGSARSAPVIDIKETDQRQAFTALESWIPGGRVDRLTWSWVEYGLHPSPWTGVTKSFTDQHRFIFPKPSGITQLSSICLRIEGFQTFANGQGLTVFGGTTCQVPEIEVIMDVPSWWEPVTVPVWLPDLPDDVLLKDAVAGHISVQTDTPRKDELTQNTLVCFADWRSPHPLEGLADALARVQRDNASLGVIVVLPAAAFDSPRKELEGKLASIRERLSTRLHVTEDAEGGWTRTFGAAKTPSLYLINARRQFVWKHEGALDTAALAAALDEHLLPAPAPRARPLRLAVSPRDRAPDVFFQDGGNHSALHRLRGQPVVLSFWQSWSAPCLKELRRLQGLHEQRSEAPYIVAFHGGKDGKALDAIRKQLGLSFPLVQDVDQRIARTYGVRCWPTTIRINADGRVEHAQFGISHEHTPHPGRGQAELT